MKKQLRFQISAVCMAVLVLCMMIGLTTPLKAQSFGSIVGTVTDASGAVIPGAKVSLTNLGTNEKKIMEADAAGSFRFVSLPPTQYKLEVEKTSYKRLVRTPVTVEVAATARIDVSLEVGAATETVEVTSAAPLLQTESGTLGSQVEGRTVQEMPLNGRNAMNLVALVPGVVPQGSSQGTTSMNQNGHSNRGGWGNYQIGGSIAGQGVTYLDGAPLTVLSNQVAFIPTQDAIQEFRVSTSAASAEFGRFGGGVIEMGTKSGSNQWHGSAYEYLRNTVLNTNTWSYNKTTQAKAGIRKKLNQNQFGVAASGPVWKNKAFFMFSWEKFASRMGNTDTFSVPTASMMADTNPVLPAGSMMTSNGKAKTIYDPIGAGKLTTAAGNLWNPLGGAGCVTTDASGNVTIATLCLDPAAQKLKNYFKDLYKSGNFSATTPLTTGNYTAVYSTGDDNNQYNVRGDVNLSANQRLFARYSKMYMKDIPANELNSAGGYNTANAGSVYFGHQAVIGDTYTVNPTTIVDVRAYYTRGYGDDRQATAGSDTAKTMLTSTLPQSGGWSRVAAAATTQVLPMVSLSNSTDNFYGFRAMGQNQQTWYNSYGFSGGVTKIQGNHTLKSGGEIRLLNRNNISASNASGMISVSGTNFAGDEWANFLLGLGSLSMNKGKMAGNYSWYQGYYINDTWTVNRKLTLNLGVRWELPGAVAEKHDAGTVLLPNFISDSGIRGTLALVNGNLWSDRSTLSPRHNLLSPRLGFAYRVDNDMVVRGGYSLTYLAPDMGTVMPSDSIVNSAATSGENNSTGTAIVNTIQSPLQYINADGSANTTTGKTVAINAPLGHNNTPTVAGVTYSSFTNFAQSVYGGSNTTGISGPVPTNDFPYMQQWNLGVGRQFKGQQSVEVGYAGALSTHLLLSGNLGLNQPSTVQQAAFQTTCTPQVDSNGQPDYDKCTGSVANYRPFANFANVQNTNPFLGTMNYHSLIVRYEKRLGSGLITSSYTRSKSIGNTDTNSSFLDSGNIAGIQNYNDLKSEHSLLSYSILNRWVTSYVVDLPFGKGKKFLTNGNGVVERLVGGWTVNGITSLQSGQPIMLTAAASNNLSKNFKVGSLRPNVVAGCNPAKSGSAQSRLSAWFDTSCFTNQSKANWTFGNEARVDSRLRSSGMANWDFSVQKATKITEKSNLQFRFEIFNLFNRRQWAMPSRSIGGGAGVVSDQKNDPRLAQASLRFAF